MKLFFIMFFSCLVITLSSCTGRAPDDLLNTAAGLPASAGFDRNGYKVLNSVFNVKTGTVAMLYGNEKARLSTPGSGEPSGGAQWALVTWKSVPDKHWFGANIPGELLSLETVRTVSGGAGASAFRYERYSGTALTKTGAAGADSTRLHFILAMQPAVMP